MSWKAKRFENTTREVTRLATTRHHRKPKSLGGCSDDNNITQLPTSLHRAWHTLFRNFTPQMIAREINDKYLDPKFFFVVRSRK